MYDNKIVNLPFGLSPFLDHNFIYTFTKSYNKTTLSVWIAFTVSFSTIHAFSCKRFIFCNISEFWQLFSWRPSAKFRHVIFIRFIHGEIKYIYFPLLSSYVIELLCPVAGPEVFSQFLSPKIQRLQMNYLGWSLWPFGTPLQKLILLETSVK